MKILLPELARLNLEATLFGGQAFRWRSEGDSTAIGWIGTTPVRAHPTAEGLEVEALGGATETLEEDARRFFDLARPYDEIERRLLRDARLRSVASGVEGIRILRQPAFETLIAFIISANNNIPRIQRSVELLCTIAGSMIETSVGPMWSFPQPEALAELSTERLREEANLGYRDRYVAETARLVAAGDVDLDALDGLATDDLRAALVGLPGVGPKVADCVALFGFGRVDVFPVDTWIRRAMSALYLRDGEEASDRVIAALARHRFGRHAGIAQQYLFEGYRLRSRR